MTQSLGAGEAVVDLLEQAGVKTVFGLLGGPMLELYDALRSSEISYVAHGTNALLVTWPMPMPVSQVGRVSCWERRQGRVSSI